MSSLLIIGKHIIGSVVFKSANGEYCGCMVQLNKERYSLVCYTKLSKPTLPFNSTSSFFSLTNTIPFAVFIDILT